MMWGDVADGGGKGPNGTGLDVSTIFVSGFSNDAGERELENLCRFIHGFVAARASVSKGSMKLWARFDCPDSAFNALATLEQQPFDMRDPSLVLRANMARTDLNPTAGPPKGKGGGAAGGGRLAPPPAVVGKGGDWQDVGGKDASHWGHRGSKGKSDWQGPETWGSCAGHKADGGGAGYGPHGPGGGGGSWASGHGKGGKDGGPPSKRPKHEVTPAENDTLIILRAEEQGHTADGLHDFFMAVHGYVGLRLGKGNCFVKFQDVTMAQAAMPLCETSGITSSVAKSSLNVNQATHVAEMK